MRGRPGHRRNARGGALAILALAGAVSCASGPTRLVSEPVPIPAPAPVPVPAPVAARIQVEQAVPDLLQPGIALSLRPDGKPGLAVGFRVDRRRHWVFIPEATLDSLFRAAAGTPFGDVGP